MKRPVKPDISVFSCFPDTHSASHRPAGFDWRTVELWIENKREIDDPFMTIQELQKHANVASYHTRWANGACGTYSRLISHAMSLHRSQFRVFSFSVAVFEESARLLRWGRSGVIYTEPFKWADGRLFEFFWRFNHLSAVDRGYDTTVSLADDGEAELALPKLRTYLKFENVRKEHLHRILVWDDCSSDDGPRRYITPNAKWATEALIGRATFGYITFDVERGNLVYLNDFWRLDHPEIQKEGDVYRELLEAEVRNIAKLGRASDVRSTIDDGQVRASVVVQRTRTQDSFESFMVPGLAVKQYVHYQLILETVGMPLNRFKSTRQLCEVIRDAVIGEGGSHASLYKLNMLIAHTNAYNNSQILHRDVSA